MFYLNFSF